MSSQTPYVPKPERGGCLSIWLALSVIAGIATVIYLQGLIPLAAQRGLSGVIYIGIIISVVGLAGVYGIYKWKRWGAYTTASLSIIVPIFQLLLGTFTIVACVSPFVQWGILYYLLKDKWDHFN